MIITNHFYDLLLRTLHINKSLCFFFFFLILKPVQAQIGYGKGCLVFASIVADTKEQNADRGNIKRVWYLTELSLWEHILLRKDQPMVEYSICFSTRIEWRQVVFYFSETGNFYTLASAIIARNPFVFMLKINSLVFLRFIVLSKPWHLIASGFRPLG